jgi:hypothetical protein
MDKYNKKEDLIKSKKCQVVDHKQIDVAKKNTAIFKSFILKSMRIYNNKLPLQKNKFL